MDTKSGYPFWVIKNGLLPDYPVLERDTRCDVLVVGGGITGSLIADHLSRHGHEVVSALAKDVGDCGFQRTDSVYLASTKRHAKVLLAEQTMRARSRRHWQRIR